MNEVAVFGGGCFWCTEAVFMQLKGVVHVEPGYSGGDMPNPSYKMVSRGMTGHAEVSKVEFDPEKIDFRDLLTVFFATHDPTTLNRQGADVGTQYRSVIFYTTEKQKDEVVAFVKELDASGPKVVTEIKPLTAFYPAEEQDKEFYLKNSSTTYCQIVINPKLEKLKKRFNELLKDN
jgi:peptide-methionine (S)-S-oxide reductase